MIKYDYKYDLTKHPYVWQYLEKSDFRGQSFTVPDGMEAITGFRIKAIKIGNPGLIKYKIGYSPNDASLASGDIDESQVTPTYELFCGSDFEPLPVQPGEKIYITLCAPNATAPLDAYKIYGPSPDENTDPERCNMWENYPCITYPLDYYSASHPPFEGGSGFDSSSNNLFSLSFIVYSGDNRENEEEEERFAFIRKLTSEPFSEFEYIRQESESADDEIILTSEWGVVNKTKSDDVVNNAVFELNEYLKICMDVSLCGRSSQIIIDIDNSKDMPDENESFIVESNEDAVHITGKSNRGVMRAIHWILDYMSYRKMPVLRAGRYVIKPRHELRLTYGIAPAPIRYYELQGDQIWTPGYMWRLSRAGYNAINMAVNIEEIVEFSSVFPEMIEDTSKITIEKLRRIVELAKKYGIDVYVEMKAGYYKFFDSKVYERLPHLKSYDNFGRFPCVSQKETHIYLTETISNLFSKVQDLKGMILIYSTEGFYCCFTHGRNDLCPNCHKYKTEDLILKLTDTLLKAIKVKNPETELIMWTYHSEYEWDYNFIKNAPKDMILMSNMSQFAEIERFGYTLRTDDYAVTSAEASKNFKHMNKLTKSIGVRYIAKTEDAFGQEFVSTLYYPCLQQHQKKWDNLIAEDLHGFMANYIHIGFTPSPCSDLARLNMYEIVSESEEKRVSAQDKVYITAVMNYGIDASKDIVAAWQCFSNAFSDYFPYTAGVCRYPGPLQMAPAQPYYMDPEREPPRKRSRGHVKDLTWTKVSCLMIDTEISDPVLKKIVDKWTDADVLRCMEAFNKTYLDGIAYMEKASLKILSGTSREKFEHELKIAKTHYFQISSMINFINFINLRDEYLKTKSNAVKKALITVCQRELESAGQVLRLCREDSRIGYSCEGAGTVRGGVFTPTIIEEKLSDLKTLIDDLYDDKY